MLIELLRRVKNKTITLFFKLKVKKQLIKHPLAKLTIHKGAFYLSGKIAVGKHSSLLIEEGVKINGDIIVGEGCQVIISKNCVVMNVMFKIINNSIVKIGEGVIFNNPERHPNVIRVDNGTLILSDRVRIQCNILVRFGGKMSIGKYTGIGCGSEIRCEEKINIGDYGMISYEVCIYDTNAHSINWLERRKRIEKGYPHGTGEERRPKTKPIQIGDDVWIGKGATITKGTVIGNRSIIGIRTIVAGGHLDDDCIIVSPKPNVISKRIAI